jgi:Domain of Unknown Function (DUF748)
MATLFGLGERLRARGVLRWPSWVLCIILAIMVAGVSARLLAPGYVQRAINRRLSQIPGYSGHVGNIDLQLWRGAYRIEDMEIVKGNGTVRDPFFTAKTIDFSIAWREMLRGKFVSDIYVTDGRLIFLRGPSDDSSQLTADHRWQDVVNDIFPIDITHLEIKGGVIRFVDTTREPQVDIGVQDLVVIATGLRNRPSREGEIFPAKIDISGRSIGDGQLRLNAQLEPLADQPHFELAVELDKVSLPALNNFLRSYVGIDVSQGHLNLFGQMAMQRGHYEGYLKPFLEDVDFKDNDANKAIGARIWKGAVVAVLKLFRNSDTQQLASRIPFSGDAKGMDIMTLRSILNGLHHGFVEALPQGFEGTTHPDATKSKLPPLPLAGSKVASGTKP